MPGHCYHNHNTSCLPNVLRSCLQFSPMRKTAAAAAKPHVRCGGLSSSIANAHVTASATSSCIIPCTGSGSFSIGTPRFIHIIAPSPLAKRHKAPCDPGDDGNFYCALSIPPWVNVYPRRMPICAARWSAGQYRGTVDSQSPPLQLTATISTHRCSTHLGRCLC